MKSLTERADYLKLKERWEDRRLGLLNTFLAEEEDLPDEQLLAKTRAFLIEYRLLTTMLEDMRQLEQSV